MAAATAPSARLRLSGKRVLVTGAGRGIGRAIALLCHREGALVVAISSRTPSELDETIALASTVCVEDVLPPHRSNNCQMERYLADVRSKEEVESMVSSFVSKWGGIDILVNNAGVPQPTKGPLETLSSADFRQLLDVNVVGVHTVTSSVLRLAMLPQRSGDIINISSRAGKVGLPNNSFYVASKFALEGMTSSLAEEIRDKGIRVKTMSPGMVDTRSFPKPRGRKGVRTAESIEYGFFALLESGATGHYLHVDELDEARAKGLPDAAALKPIREDVFSPA